MTLEVTPSITNSGLIALNIHMTVEEANGSVTIANVGDVPITRRTERSAKMIVSDRSVLVLDGSLEQTNATPRPFKRMLTLNGLFHHPKIRHKSERVHRAPAPDNSPDPRDRSPIIKSRKR